MFSLWAVTTLVIVFIVVNAYHDIDIYTTFDYFKKKYQKKYATKEDEVAAYERFVKNFDMVTSFNENPKETENIYVLNKYADVDPKEIQEHFGLSVSPYDRNKLYKGPPIRNRHILRSQHKVQPEKKDLESMELYDLNDAENLYQRYQEAFNKTNYTKEYDRTVHYLRFVKSLVDINREHYNGTRTKVIDSNSDVVDHPKEYFY